MTTQAAAFVVSLGLAWAIGNRYEALTSLAMLLWLPTWWAMSTISLRLFPADVQVIVAGWTPDDSDADQELEQAFEALREIDPVLNPRELQTPPTLEQSMDDSPGPLPLSTPKAPPVTFEGVAIAIAFSALFAYHVYTAIEPHLTRGH